MLGTLRAVFFFVAQARLTVAAVLLLGCVMALFDLLIPMAIGLVFNMLMSRGQDPVGWMPPWPQLAALAALLLVVRPLLQWLHNLVTNVGMHSSFTSMVRCESNAQVMRRGLPFFQQDLAGRIASHVMRIGPALRNSLVLAMATVWQFAILVGVAVALLLNAHWLMALPLACWLVLLAVLLSITLPSIHRLASIANEEASHLTGRVVDVYSNMGTVVAFGQIEAEQAEFDRANRQCDLAVRQQMRVTATQGLFLSVLNASLVVAIVGLGLYLLATGDIGIATLVIAIPLAWQVSNISSVVAANIAACLENMGVVRDAMLSIAPLVSAPATLEPPRPKLHLRGGEICFESVSFGYRHGLGVISNLSMSIRSGEHVGIVGTSGAGKSTLVGLLLAILEPDQGRILIDGQSIATVDLNSLREAIGLVPQDTALFHRTIEMNIAYGRPGATRAEVIEAAQRSHADDFIQRHVDWCNRTGYDAQVGERGAQLSGGQRQRIAVARAMLKNAPILILDEATNALDSETEFALQKDLGEMMKGKTVIAIAHRLSTIARMDRLIVISGGEIVEEGKPAELLARGGAFVALWNHQHGNFL